MNSKGACSTNQVMKATESDSDSDGDEDSQINSSMTGLEESFSNDKRTSRNQNEKNRRDLFNSLIQDLGSLINSKRKIDKASVLNEAIIYFQNNSIQTPKEKEISSQYKPFFMKNHDFLKFMFEFQNAFCLVFDLNGQIRYTSNEIKHLLDHEPKDLDNENIFEYIDEKSSKLLKQILRNTHYLSESIQIDCKIKRGNVSASYEPFRISGVFKRTPDSTIGSIGHFNTIARHKSFSKISPASSFHDRGDFDVRYSLDLKFTKLDSRATIVIGYCPMEVLGTSAYDYCHMLDVQKLAECHKNVIETKLPIAISYRFITKGEQALLVTANFNYQDMPAGINCTVSPGLKDASPSIDKSIKVQSTGKVGILEMDSIGHENAKRRRQIDSTETTSIESKILNTDTRPQAGDASLIMAQNGLSIKPPEGFGIPKTVQTTQQSSDRLDENLAAIFLRSFHDVAYRSYVLKQLHVKKAGVERVIKKNQNDLVTLTQTIESISDVKKLGAWLYDFQKNKKTRLQSSPAALVAPDNSTKSPNLPTSVLEENIPINNSSQIQMQPVSVPVQSSLDMGGVSTYNVPSDMSTLPLEKQPSYNYPMTKTSNTDIEMMEKIFKNYPDKF